MFSETQKPPIWVAKRVYNVCMKRLNFFLPEQVIHALQALSDRTGITVSEHIRRAIDAYLKKNK